MTLTLGLLLLTLPVLAVRRRWGDGWWAHPIAVLCVATLTYHGLNEVILAVFGEQRRGMARADLHDPASGAVIPGAYSCAAVMAYLIAARDFTPSSRERLAIATSIPWSVTAALLTPLVVATIRGSGYANGQALTGEGGTEAYATQFLLPLVVITASMFGLRHPRLLPHALIAQSLVLALAGQRLELIVCAVATLGVCRAQGVQLSRRQTRHGILALGLLGWGITASRSLQGRSIFQSESSLGDRLSAVFNGALTSSYQGVHSNNPLVDLALRLDSNSWASNVAQSLGAGIPPMGAQPITNSFLSTIPSPLWPNKLNVLDLNALSPELWQGQAMQMPDIDYLPGHMTLFLPATGIYGGVALAGALGLCLALLERLADSLPDSVNIVVLATTLISAAFYERGIPEFLIGFRTVLVLAPALYLLQKLIRPYRRSPITDSRGLASPRTGRKR